MSGTVGKEKKLDQLPDFYEYKRKLIHRVQHLSSMRAPYLKQILKYPKSQIFLFRARDE